MKRLAVGAVLIGFMTLVSYCFLNNIGSHCDTTSCQMSNQLPLLLAAQAKVENGLSDEKLEGKAAGFHSGFIDVNGRIIITVQSKATIVSFQAEGLPWRCDVYPPQIRKNKVIEKIINSCSS